MPLINQPRFREESVLPDQPLAPEKTIQEFATPEPKADFLGTIKSSLQTYNTVGELYTGFSTGAYAIGTGDIDLEYSPWDEIEGTVYQNYAKSFARAGNKTDEILIKNQIDKELDNEEILRQSGALGTVMSLGAGLLDPVNLVGGVIGGNIAGSAIGGGLLKGTATGALGFLLAERGSDAVSRLTRETYDPTLEETAVDIGVATLLGGVLGTAGAKYLQGAPKETIAKAEKDFANVEPKELTATGELVEPRKLTNTIGGTLSAAVTPELEKPFDYSIAKGSNIASDLPVKAVKSANLTPQTRLANSVSSTMRKIGTKLLRTGGTVYEGTVGSRGIALTQSAESIKGIITSDFSKASYDYNNHYLEFKKAHAKKPTNITEDQFRRETIRVIEGDPAINPALEKDPSIKAASDVLKKHLDNLAKQSIEQELLTQESFDKREGKYFPRQFDKQAVMADEQRFRDTVATELHKAVRQNDLDRLDKVSADIENIEEKFSTADEQLAQDSIVAQEKREAKTKERITERERKKTARETKRAEKSAKEAEKRAAQREKELKKREKAIEKEREQLAKDKKKAELEKAREEKEVAKAEKKEKLEEEKARKQLAKIEEQEKLQKKREARDLQRLKDKEDLQKKREEEAAKPKDKRKTVKQIMKERSEMLAERKEIEAERARIEKQKAEAEEKQAKAEAEKVRLREEEQQRINERAKRREEKKQRREENLRIKEEEERIKKEEARIKKEEAAIEKEILAEEKKIAQQEEKLIKEKEQEEDKLLEEKEKSRLAKEKTDEQLAEERTASRDGQKYDKLLEEQKELEKYINNPVTSDDRVMGAVDRLVDHIVNGPIQMPEVGKLAIAGPLKGRTLNIKSMVIEDFLIRDPIYILDRYSQKVGGLIGLKKALGQDILVGHDGGVHFKPEIEAKIKQEYNSVINETLSKVKSDFMDKLEKKNKELTPELTEKLNKQLKKKAVSLRNQMQRDINDTISLFELLTGSGNRYTTDPSSMYHTTLNSLKKINFLSKMGGVALSSFPDLSRLTSVYGLEKAVKGNKILFKNISSNLTKAEKAQIENFGQFADATLKNSLINIVDTNFTHGTTKFERSLNNLTKFFSKTTFIEMWNNQMTQTAAGLSMDSLTKVIKRFGRGGELTEKEWTNINNVYRLSKNDLTGMAKELEVHSGVSANGYEFPYYDNWGDRDLADKFRIAVKEEAQRTIVTKDIGNVPLWFNTPLGSLISQFRAFNFAMTMKGVIPALQGLDRAPVKGFMMAASLGALIVAAKDLAAGREMETDPVKLLVRGIDQSGYLGILADADGIANALALPSLTGYSYGRYNYADKNILGAFTPTGGTLEDLQTALSAIKTLSMDRRQIHAVRKLIPFQNLFYLRRAFDKIEEQAND